MRFQSPLAKAYKDCFRELREVNFRYGSFTARASLTDASVSNVATCRCTLKQRISLLRKEATIFKAVCTTTTPDTVKLFSGNATGKLLFGVARCDNVLYCFWEFSSNFLFIAPCGGSGVWPPGPCFGGPALVCCGSLGVPAGLFSSAVG